MRMDFKKFSYPRYLLIFALCLFSFSIKQRINIVFIGDSITQGGEAAGIPPVFATAFLEKQLGFGKVKFSNQGVSGCTTIDFLPSTATHFHSLPGLASQMCQKNNKYLRRLSRQTILYWKL